MSSPSLTTLPSDALLVILTHLAPADITRLSAALPPTSEARRLTHDPCLWQQLYRRYFRAGWPPQPSPYLLVTQDGRLDWRAAFWEADRRQQALRRRPRLGPDMTRTPTYTNRAPPANIRVDIRGNIRRIVATSSDTASANITWDQNIAAARFDWTGRARPLSDGAFFRHRPRPLRPSRTIPLSARAPSPS